MFDNKIMKHVSIINLLSARHGGQQANSMKKYNPLHSAILQIRPYYAIRTEKPFLFVLISADQRTFFVARFSSGRS